MKEAAKSLDFEEAANLRDRVKLLRLKLSDPSISLILQSILLFGKYRTIIALYLDHHAYSIYPCHMNFLK